MEAITQMRKYQKYKHDIKSYSKYLEPPLIKSIWRIIYEFLTRK